MFISFPCWKQWELLSKKHLSHPTVLSRSILQSQTLYPSSGLVGMGKHSSANDNTNGKTVYVSLKTYQVTLKDNGGNQTLTSSELCKQSPGFRTRNTLFSIILLPLVFHHSSHLNPPLKAMWVRELSRVQRDNAAEQHGSDFHGRLEIIQGIPS